MRSEANISNDCMVALSEAGCKVWRNNTGALKDQTGRLVRFGLAVGSGDLIGIAPDGIFFSVEVKRANGKATTKQSIFINVVRGAGGRAGIARSGKESVDIAIGLVVLSGKS